MTITRLAAVLAPLLALASVPAVAALLAGSDNPLIHTYSIVARDPKTGELGVAVQSHWFSVGSLVTWAEPGVGAVATQSIVEVSYGPLGLERMRSGKSAPDALKELLAADPQRDVRQVAMIDAQGRVAAWTGPSCIPEAGDVQGEQFSAQANLMASAKVWPAMKKAFESASGDLADRLLAALDAAEAAGGDIRGRQSAALLIVKGERTDAPWSGKLFDLRVEDHPWPLKELRRLVAVQRAYRFADRGDTLVAEGKVPEAMAAYSKASELLPGNLELLYWKAVGFWNAGRKEDALPVFRQVFRREPAWKTLTPRLVPIGLLKADAGELEAILTGRLRTRKP
jgi:uncharacterized Ntn-hydrolase superfamily protein